MIDWLSYTTSISKPKIRYCSCNNMLIIRYMLSRGFDTRFLTVDQISDFDLLVTGLREAHSGLKQKPTAIH